MSRPCFLNTLAASLATPSSTAPRKSRQTFQHGDLGPQAAPHRTHLQPDHAGADHTQLLGHGTDLQRAVVAEDLLLVEGRTRQRTGAGAGGHHHLLGLQGLLTGLQFIAAVLGRHEAAAAVEEADLVLLEQVEDAVVVLLHDEVLARQHLGHVDPGVVGRDAVLGEVVVQVLEVLAGLQQGLGGDATDIGAGAARGRTAGGVLPLVDAGDVHTELRGADGGDVAAGAGADDDEIEVL
jgi:hypothetical protein